jgi:flagellar motor switch protein FliN
MADDPVAAMASTEAADPGDGGSPFAALEPHADLNGAAAAPVNTGSAGSDLAALDLVFEVPVRLSVELGRTDISIREVINLGRGSIIELDRGPGTPLDVRINGVLIGRGEVVLVNEEKLGLRFVEVVSQAERVKRLG